MIHHLTQPCQYNSYNKERFHRTGQRLLRQVGNLLGEPFDLRSNRGGIAVSGEVTLHTDRVYIQLYQSCIHGPSILVRRCKGRDDYTGGVNHNLNIEMIEPPERFVQIMKGLIQ